MAAWSYPVTDWRTGNPVYDDAPLAVEPFTDGLGVAQGGLTGRLKLAGLDPRLADDLILPWRRVIWPCKDGRPYGAYVVTAHAPFGPKSTSVEFAAARVDVVFTRREIWSSLKFVQVDQHLIARNLMAYALGLFPSAVEINYLAVLEQKPLAARVPWMLLDSSLSGVLRDRLDDNDGYQQATHHKISEALTNLTNLEDGFDYRLDYARAPVTGALTVTVRLGYPALGRTVPVLPAEYPGNVTTWSVALDTADTVTSAKVFGAGQGVERTISLTAIDYTAHDQGWPLLEGSQDSTASVALTLDAAARAFLADQAGVNGGWAIQLDGDALGTYEIGDQAALVVSHPRWGTAYQTVRITGHKVEPSRPGRAERVTPTLVGVGPMVTRPTGRPAPTYGRFGLGVFGAETFGV